MQSKVITAIHLRITYRFKTTPYTRRGLAIPLLSASLSRLFCDSRMQPDGRDAARMWRVSPAGYFGLSLSFSLKNLTE
jgi:hypothetical protein